MVYRTFVRDSTRWDGFPLRADDIVISTPAKCGTTWMQMICALLVFQSAELPAPLSTISPWLDMLTRPRDDVVADLAAQTHRRFIKTHVPLDGLPYDEQVTYVGVGRDPRDVVLSWDNHRSNQDRQALARARDETVGPGSPAVDPLSTDPPPSLDERVRAWIDDEVPPTESVSSLWLTLHHLNTFWSVRDEPNIVLLHYADLQGDLDGQMRLLTHRLGIPIDEERWPSLVEAATLSSMRANADQLAPDAAAGLWHDNRQFFNRGGAGEWAELLSEEDLAHYWRRVGALAPRDLAGWVHRGDERAPAAPAAHR